MADRHTAAEVPNDLPTCIDDVPAASVPVDRKQLEACGLVEVRAWMQKRAAPQAARKARHRARQHAHGLRQMNVVVPDTDEARAAISAVAQGLRAGTLAPADVEAFAAQCDAGSAPNTPLARETRELAGLLEAGGWRARLLRFLARAARGQRT